MKNKNILFALALAVVATVLAGCSKEDNDPSAEDLFLQNLSGEWTLGDGVVTLDDVSVTDFFEGMEITFTDKKTYAVTGGIGPIWPAQGTFKLEQGNTDLFNLRRDDGVLITITEC